jgi:hypothetical protein
MSCLSCESRNPEKDWIPGQARNDNLLKNYVVMFNSLFIPGQIILIDFFLRLTYKGNNVGGSLD